MGGAKRALIIVVRNGSLIIDSVSNKVEEDFPEASKEILEKMDAKDNDVIIIAGADDPLKAKRGAFAASWVLVGDD